MSTRPSFTVEYLEPVELEAEPLPDEFSPSRLRRSLIAVGAVVLVVVAAIVLAVLLGVPSLMMFDWVFWLAGRRWGDRVFVWLLGGESPRSGRRLARLHRVEARFGPWAVVLAYLLPVPSAVIYAAVGDGGMRLRTFLVLDALGTVLWTGLLAGAGYALGRSAVDVANAVARYSLWVTIGIVIAITVWRAATANARIGRESRPG